MSRVIRVASSPGEHRIAVFDDGVLSEFWIERPGDPDGVGDLHRGRIVAHLPALGGAFVALDGSADGFLPDSEGAAGHGDGTLLGVRVTRSAQAGKGPRLTARLSPDEAARTAEGSERRIARGPDAIARLLVGAAATWIVDDRLVAARLRPHAVAITEAAFDDATLSEVEPLFGPDVELPGGMRASIHPTPALVAIDVDTGRASGERSPKRAAQTRANVAALPDLARQMRLRNLSGAIVLDVAGLSTRARAGLSPALTEALAIDPLKPRFLGFSALGLAEIVRPRIHPPLHERLIGPHAAGLAALRAVMRVVRARPGWAPRLRATPDIVAKLRADPVALPDLERLAGRALMLISDPALRPAAPSAGWSLEE